jgi:hypothetical protein
MAAKIAKMFKTGVTRQGECAALTAMMILY